MDKVEKFNTVIVGAGQAGLAMSAHLTEHGIGHVILERDRVVERWRTARWDSLVANGPAWHDRFPALEFECDGDVFPSKDEVVKYFETFAKNINAPVREGVEVLSAEQAGSVFFIETDKGAFGARNIVVATGAFQKPVIPPLVPASAEVKQIHSFHYRNPESLDDGAVLVVGAGSSGAQIADELRRSGREVYLSIGPHDRPPRRYRGRDNVWWLGVLGIWQMKTPPKGREHVTIAVSGARGGHTIDFRDFAANGITLLGMTESFSGGKMRFADDLEKNIHAGDENHHALLDAADAYVRKNNLDLPDDPDARKIAPDPECVTNPVLELDLAEKNITTIIWATGYAHDFDWLKVDAFDDGGKPLHEKGVAKVSGIYFLGLPWLSMRGSSFIWGVWEDAKYLAGHIAARKTGKES